MDVFFCFCKHGTLVVLYRVQWLPSNTCGGCVGLMKGKCVFRVLAEFNANFIFVNMWIFVAMFKPHLKSLLPVVRLKVTLQESQPNFGSQMQATQPTSVLYLCMCHAFFSVCITCVFLNKRLPGNQCLCIASQLLTFGCDYLNHLPLVPVLTLFHIRCVNINWNSPMM